MTNYYACSCGSFTHNRKDSLKCFSCNSKCVNLFIAPKYYYHYKCGKCGNFWKSSILCNHKSKCAVCKEINGLLNGSEFEQLYSESRDIIILLRTQKNKLYNEVDPTFQRKILNLKNKIFQIVK